MMCEFSAGDGFVEINESLGDMIKYIANEPSVGLYYIQQHAQHAVPNVLSLRNNVVENSRETLLQAEDLEDSITMIRSMKECGPPIADEMILEIKKSLAIMSTKQPKKGLIQRPNSGFQMGGKSGSWTPSIWNRNTSRAQRDTEGSGSYISSVIQSAKQKAGNIKWPQLDLMELREIKGEDSASYHDRGSSAPGVGTSSALLAKEAEELPLSSPIVDETEEGSNTAARDGKLKSGHISSRSDNYEEFKADREARLEMWLGGGDVEADEK